MTSQSRPSPRIIARRQTQISPWVTLVARDVDAGATVPETWHALEVADYVSVLAVTPDGHVPLVRQYRPAVERTCLELPGGLAEPPEPPLQTAARELREETGFVAPRSLIPIGRLATDHGRLNNWTWGFFARNAVFDGSSWTAEPGVDLVMWSIESLREAVRDGTFNHAPHVALIGLAALQGLI